MKDYFFKPPINKISLNFLERPLETAYRVSYQEEVLFTHTHTHRIHTLTVLQPPAGVCELSQL